MNITIIKKNQLSKKIIICFLGFLSPLFAAKNIFNIVPTIKAPIFIYPGRVGIAYYKVTNNTRFTLNNVGVHNLPAGVIQDPVGSGLSPEGLITCRSPFNLEPKASCLLKLNIIADKMTQPIQYGPEVCQNASSSYPIYCSTPDIVSNNLNITKLNTVSDSAATLDIIPNNLSLVTGGLQTITVTNTSSTVTVNNIVANFSGTILDNNIVQTVRPNPGGGNACSSLAPGRSCVISLVSYSQVPFIPNTAFRIEGANSKSTTSTASIAYSPPDANYQTLLNSPLVNADIWNNTPQIMSANFGFQGIEAIPQGESDVINAGGAWNIISTPDAGYAAYTSAGNTSTVAGSFGYTVYYNDALPICFSQPLLTSTVNPTNFRLTLNTGEIITPNVASLSPNFFYNESSCIVLFGLFGNRIPPGEVGAVYPTNVSIVEGSANGTPIHLTLVGPGNVLTDMVGKSKSSIGNPYLPNGGAKLLAAKLSRMQDVAVGQNTQPAFRVNVPNDGIALYGSEAQYRLRMYTTAGFALGNFTPSASRPMSLMPTDYNNVFRVQIGPDNNPIYLYEAGVEYTIPGYGTIEVVGLASLGKAGTPENDAYVGDGNNYIDIILKGDQAAMQQITYVDIPTNGTNPSTGTPYLKLYNPGGPGNNPTPGIYYTQPGPAVHMAVTQALNDPNTVTYP